MKRFYYIYKITNKVNGKIYYGQHTTHNLGDGYMGSGIALNKAFMKYGRKNFVKKILMFCSSMEELNIIESRLVSPMWLARNSGKTYNLVPGGGSGGFHHSKETRLKLRDAALRGFKNGRKHPMLGKHLSDEQKERQRLSHLGQKSWIKGKHLSEEVRKKLSDSKRKYCSEHPNSTSRNKNKHWYNNGQVSVLRYECPEGFVGGRL